MKLCRSTKASKVNRFVACFLLIIVLLLLGFCVYGFTHMKSMVDYFNMWLILLLAILLGWTIAIPYFYMETRCYRFEESGILVGGSFRRPQRYDWGEIREIGIYAFGANSSVTAYGSVICCFWGNKSNDFERKIIKDYFYAAYRQKDFVLIDYSDDLIDELRSFYPRKIHDYRAEQIKYYNPETYRKMQNQ